MNFDLLVTSFEESLLPTVRNQEIALRSSGLYTKVKVASMRHADVIHAMGITCRPMWAKDDLEYLSFVVTLNNISEFGGRIDVQWSQCFSTRTGSGYLKKEASGFHSRLGSEEQIAEFERQWFRYSRLFMRVALKGGPSMKLFRRLRGAPRDQYGWKDAALTEPAQPAPGLNPSASDL